MEVVALSGNSNNAPFKREVHEWQHIDAKTGALLSGRAEANRYVNGNVNTYGKSLLQSFETTDGTKHKQHKQMDILQTITSTGGALQVVRAQTIQTSHSSSRRALTSTTYSHYTNGTSSTTAAGASDDNTSMSSDLLSISPRTLQQHSPTSSRMKALLSSSYFSSSPTASNDGSSSNNRKNDLFHHINNNDMNNGVGSVEAEFSRQQQMNEMLYGSKESYSSNSFLRGKSASIEDLANINNDNDDDDVKPYDWKRVSKIRRSLQFPKTSETSRGRINYARSSRPADLPENSVNVWKIRQDLENLENMRKMNGTVKVSTNNNNINGFVALDTILKNESSPMDSLNSNHSCSASIKDEMKSDCLTAESLQEIRRRLKKLNVLNSDAKYNDEILLTVHENANQKTSLEQNSKSLELRKNRERDISADDWLNRRKSYGFEKMYQPNESSSLGGIESSTDSGLGRSSDLPSNWSPTVDSPQRTIITFGDKTKPAATTSISLFSNPVHHDKPIPMRRRSVERKEELKRHSIAIDEKVDEHYHQRNSNDRKISLVNLNGPYNDKLTSAALINDGRHKKVEFCKTEIHFAAESGRVNIVETDGKPPPTNNFRRRRRNSGAVLDHEYSIQQESMQIDDDEFDKLAENNFDAIERNNVTTTVGTVHYSSAREDDTDEGHSDTDGLRGILKNKPIKPKPYHLGENLESGSSLWGVRLRPVENQHTTWRHSAELESAVTAKKSTEDALEAEFKNLVMAMDQEKSTNNNHFQSTTVSSNGYSTKINLSSLPAIQQQHPANKDPSSPSSMSLLTSSATTSATHKPSTFTSYNDSHKVSGNVLPDKDQRQKGGHKISIDLKLPHPSSMDTIMDELKSTSLIIKTMKSTSYFDDAMKHFEQESPLIRTSSLRLNNESLPKSSSTSHMFRNKSSAPVRYTSSLDGDHGILDGADRRDDDFDFLNGFLEENRKFQVSIAQKEKEKRPSVSTSSNASDSARPVAAPRLKKIMNPSQQLSQQLSQLKHLYDNANDSDENAMADEEVKSFLSKNEEEKSISELSGSWSRVRVKKIASAFQSSSTATTTGDGTKWAKTPLTSLYENSTSSTKSSSASIVNPITKPVMIEAAPRTSLIQIGSNHEKVNSNSNIYSNVNTIQQDNSVKVNIQNFESLSPALSRSNSLRIKRDNVVNSNSIGTKDDSSTPKLSTGTRQLKAHELTYFGVKSSKTITTKTSDTNLTNKSPFTHLSTSTNVLSSSNKLNISNNTSDKRHAVTNNVLTTTSSSSSKVTINHQKPDLIMHHQQKSEKSSTPELSSSERKSLLETLDSCIDETKNLEPIYENLYQNGNKYDRKLDLARDKKILDELTRAADEIMNTCKEMYHADSEEKRRKSLLLTTSNGTCLETIREGTEASRQQYSASDIEQPKVMKSKGVQVSRNFEDSLRRYSRMQQRTSSQSSIESLPRNSKVTSSPTVTTRTKRTSTTTKSGESTASTTVSSTRSTSCRKRENGNGSDGSKRIQRVCSRERMHKSNASSSESDHPNSSAEVPRRPRRTKVMKQHREEAEKDEKKSSRVVESSSVSKKSSKPEHSSVRKDTKVRSSVINKTSSSANPNSTIVSTGGITTSSSRSKSRR